jgi:hypothetical protein
MDTSRNTDGFPLTEKQLFIRLRNRCNRPRPSMNVRFPGIVVASSTQQAD